MASWRIWYGDGSTYSDDDGPLDAAPATNVVCVTYHTDDPKHAHGHMIVHKFDFYWWDEPDWYGGELFGLFDYLCRPGPKKVVFGRTLPDEQFTQILMRAIDGREFTR